MTPDSLPAKPERGAKFEPARRDAPTKDERSFAAMSERRSMPAKPAMESAAQEGGKKSKPGDAHQPPSREPPDQERSQRPEWGGEQYLRLRVRVDDGALSIVGSRLVDGPLAQTTAFQGRFAYEVTDGRRLLHAGSIPDLGTVRSFAHPNGTLEQQRHHSYELSSYEFDARVSVALLKGADLSNIAVALYRVKQPARPDAAPVNLSGESLAMQRERQFREIGRVVGVPASVLPPELADEAGRTVSRRSTAKKVRSDDAGKDEDGEEGDDEAGAS